MLTIETRQLNDIGTWMKQDRGTDLPDILKGVFFMDGNPFPDDCLTLEGGKWDARSRTLLVSVFSPFQWTFSVSDKGRRLLNIVNLTKLTYKVQFDETFRHAQITPIVFGFGLPKWIAEFTMTQLDDDMQGNTWERKNSWLLGLSDAWGYTLRKILDQNRQYTPTFSNLQSSVPNEFLVITNNE
ncbi:hypothetical protein MC7420_3909 [Coleofasciculus chthonoplastes PCC 7420]|uniref:Uncharacterized protein n=1 Tax=Coleofasciculus chthonoplastes PCC 7420 TaxID=118168 RepID=B4VU89_9CYAN|nr:hypothetical protein [Coleofasciculus chthonoplastes]EDX74385.1 hypothetical protein MC7420_3909 [Coleofasciculus chthonoplastes PCC 7420]